MNPYATRTSWVASDRIDVSHHPWLSLPGATTATTTAEPYAALMETLTYEVDGRVARITLDRPERGNGITLDMPRELAECVERANLDPAST